MGAPEAQKGDPYSVWPRQACGAPTTGDLKRPCSNPLWWGPRMQGPKQKGRLRGPYHRGFEKAMFKSPVVGAQDAGAKTKRTTPTAFGCPGGPKRRPLQRLGAPEAQKGDPYSVLVPRRPKRATPTAFRGHLVAGLRFGFERLERPYALGCPGGALEIPLGEPKRATPTAFGCPGGPKRRPLQRLGAPEAQKGDPYSVWRASGRRAKVWLRKP